MNQPKEYAASNSKVYQDVADLIKEFSEEFRKMDGRIIDIGCGPGNITKSLLLPNVGKDAVIVGADLSAAMVEYAMQNYTVKDKVSFLQLDIETSELPEQLIGQFDNAVSFYCLHWCRNTKAAMGNIYKLLRPGGKAIVLFISHILIFDIYPEQQKNSKFSAYMQDTLKFIPPHQGCPNAEEMLRSDLNEVRFKIHHCTNKWKTFTYRNLDTFIDLMMSVNPFFKRMPEDVQKDYRKDTGERLKNKHHQPEKTNEDFDLSYDSRVSLLTAVFEKPRN